MTYVLQEVGRPVGSQLACGVEEELGLIASSLKQANELADTAEKVDAGRGLRWRDGGELF